MEPNTRKNRWTMGPWWIVANGFAWGVFYLVDILVRWAGGLITPRVMLGFFPLRQYDYYTGAWIGAITCGLLWGALVGLMQRLALRRSLVKRGIWWILATMVGLVPLGMYLFLFQVLTSAVGLPGNTYARLETIFDVTEFIAPVWLGLLQWLVLRRTFRLAGLWIAAAAVVTGLVTFTFPTAPLTLAVFRPQHALLLLAPGALGLAYAVVTLIVLLVLPRRPARPILQALEPAPEEAPEAASESAPELGPDIIE